MRHVDHMRQFGAKGFRTSKACFSHLEVPGANSPLVPSPAIGWVSSHLLISTWLLCFICHKLNVLCTTAQVLCPNRKYPPLLGTQGCACQMSPSTSALLSVFQTFLCWAKEGLKVASARTPDSAVASSVFSVGKSLLLSFSAQHKRVWDWMGKDRRIRFCCLVLCDPNTDCNEIQATYSQT